MAASKPKLPPTTAQAATAAPDRYKDSKARSHSPANRIVPSSTTLSTASCHPDATHASAATPISTNGQGRLATPVSSTPTAIISNKPATGRPLNASNPPAKIAAANSHKLMVCVHWNPHVNGSTASSSPIRKGSSP